MVGLLASVAAPVAQPVYLRVQAVEAERAALGRLEGRPAPALDAEYTLNGPLPAATVPPAFTVVNFWATWCTPCVEEPPFLEKFSRRHDDGKVRLIGFTRLYGDPEGAVAQQLQVDAIGAFLEEHGVTYPNRVETDRSVHVAFAVEHMPSTVLLDSEGRVVDFGVGIRGSERIVCRVEEALASGA